MKHNKSSRYVSRDPTDIYYIRILEMMRDYEISMKEAIEWDFDGFMPYPLRSVMLTPEEEIDFYLHMNHVPKRVSKFFAGVALGTSPDYGLENEKPVEQKDTRSSGQA